MSVREVLQFLSQFPLDSEVVPCDWEDSCAIRVFLSKGGFDELRWEYGEEEDF